MFENCESMSAQSVPAGTRITADGRSYITQSSASVPSGSGGFGGCSSPGQSDPVSVVADDIGSDYNMQSGATFSVAGHANNSSTVYFRAVASSGIDGGSKKEVKVVTAADIKKATSQLTEQSDEEVKKQLASQFDDTVIVIDETFTADQGDVVSTPAAGAEASDGKARLTGDITYTLTGVEKGEIALYLDEYFKKQLEGKDDQRVYENGSNGASFTSVAKSEGAFSATITATAKIGPKINDDEIKEVTKGKRYGEIQSAIESKEGVEDVDIKYWPFWVSSAPNDTKRINIEFKLNE